MKPIIFFLAITLSVISSAYQASPRTPDEMVIVDASTVPAAYDGTSGSQVKTNQRGITRGQLFNTSATIIIASVSNGACSGSSKDHYIVPANSGGVEILQMAAGTSLCLRTDGAATPGKVYISTW